jgi:hypothetical protein
LHGTVPYERVQDDGPACPVPVPKVGAQHRCALFTSSGVVASWLDHPNGTTARTIINAGVSGPGTRRSAQTPLRRGPQQDELPGSLVGLVGLTGRVCNGPWFVSRGYQSKGKTSGARFSAGDTKARASRSLRTLFLRRDPVRWARLAGVRDGLACTFHRSRLQRHRGASAVTNVTNGPWPARDVVRNLQRKMGSPRLAARPKRRFFKP